MKGVRREMAEFFRNAILVENRSVREVAATHGVSKSWLYELLARRRSSSRSARSRDNNRDPAARHAGPANAQVPPTISSLGG
jgi:hypothetical protein